MDTPLDPQALNQLFIEARTHSHWQNKEVSDELLKQLYDLCKWGPTSMNCSPMRLVFVRSHAAKEQLKPLLSAGNVEKTMSAPVTAIVASDHQFYEHFPLLFPHSTTARDRFANDQTATDITAFRNSSLQGAYLIIAARSLGLDCGPMSGFDNEALDKVS
ncbi:MAG TPA: malonic semialdehyde reductase, partial [Gammaproteobacteria bacterium]|nr:malonic semialdehyde reductase [Gammaproteobacteria bacterium]